MAPVKTEPMVYKVGLKEVIQVLTKNLFESLFSAKEDRDLLLEQSKTIFLQHFDSYVSNKSAVSCFEEFMQQIPSIRSALDLDAMAFEKNDPAAKSLEEVYLAYPGFFSIAVYRLAHEFCQLGVDLVPRMMTEYAHSLVGVDIHPKAEIGHSFFIDHGTGIVIGETAIIGNHVSMYQGVTLGGIKVDKEMARTKRHPTIEDNVTIYANATILGGDITIGHHSVIGANVWITQSIPPNSIVSYQTQINIKTQYGN